MPTYEYQCPTCGRLASDVMPVAAYHQSRNNPRWCDDPDCPGEMRRSYEPPAVQPAMPGHWNPSLGRYVTGQKDFRDGLKAASDANAERTGVATNYQPVDFRESPAAFGVTSEGLDATNRVRHSEGLPTLNIDKL